MSAIDLTAKASSAEWKWGKSAPTLLESINERLNEILDPFKYSGSFDFATYVGDPAGNLDDLRRVLIEGIRNNRSGEPVDEHLLPWQGELDNRRGFARVDEETTEDGVKQKVLRTHPKLESRGMIIGTFPHEKLPKGARFKAQVGFLEGARHTGGVTFAFVTHEANNLPFSDVNINS